MDRPQHPRYVGTCYLYVTNVTYSGTYFFHFLSLPVDARDQHAYSETTYILLFAISFIDLWSDDLQSPTGWRENPRSFKSLNTKLEVARNSQTYLDGRWSILLWPPVAWRFWYPWHLWACGAGGRRCEEMPGDQASIASDAKRAAAWPCFYFELHGYSLQRGPSQNWYCTVPWERILPAFPSLVLVQSPQPSLNYLKLLTSSLLKCRHALMWVAFTAATLVPLGRMRSAWMEDNLHKIVTALQDSDGQSSSWLLDTFGCWGWAEHNEAEEVGEDWDYVMDETFDWNAHKSWDPKC